MRNILDINMCKELSRVTEGEFAKDENRYNYTHSSGISIPGRMVLNIWRLLRSEVKLNNYSYQNTVFHVIHRR